MFNYQAGTNPWANMPQNPGNIYLQGTGNYTSQPFTTADLVRNDLITDPSYQFRFGEGQRAIQNRAAALGKRFSGNMLQALTDYGQDYASTEYGNAYNRIAALSGTAQGATSQMNQAGQNYANNVGNAAIGAGDARANAAMASGQAQAGMWNALGQAGQNIFNNVSWSNPFGGSSSNNNSTGGYFGTTSNGFMV